jgi:hypothetical protein
MSSGICFEVGTEGLWLEFVGRVTHQDIADGNAMARVVLQGGPGADLDGSLAAAALPARQQTAPVRFWTGQTLPQTRKVRAGQPLKARIPLRAAASEGRPDPKPTFASQAVSSKVSASLHIAPSF